MSFVFIEFMQTSIESSFSTLNSSALSCSIIESDRDEYESEYAPIFISYNEVVLNAVEISKIKTNGPRSTINAEVFDLTKSKMFFLSISNNLFIFYPGLSGIQIPLTVKAC